MFNFLKTFFVGEQVEPVVFENIKTGETHEFGESVDGTATIRQMKNGKFRLLVNGNEVIGTYGRLRDARRGASRKGLTVMEQAIGG
jgi:hypothetical protein